MKTSEQWFQDHYPVEAASLKDASDKECIEHSMAKFKGFLPENLPDGWSYRDHYLFGPNGDVQLVANCGSCALCQKYPSNECENADGTFCPIKRFTGNTCDDHESKPYQIYYLSGNNPKPMLDLLSLTLLVEGDD